MREKVCVIGAGRIGLPLALLVAERGYPVTLVDKNINCLRILEEKGVPFEEPHLDQYINIHIGKNVHLTHDHKTAIESSKIVLITIGTGISPNNIPNMSNLWSLIQDISGCQIKDKLLIFKSTFPIGTTEQIKSILEKNFGFTAEKDFFLAFCPERVVEGKVFEEFGKLPKIIGGIGPKSASMAAQFMESLGEGKAIIVKNSKAAEFIKLIDNSFRVTKFGYANDLALISEEIGLDIYEIIDAANQGYKRNDIPYPSCGVGGYCLTKDPYYLETSFERINTIRGFHSVWYYARKASDNQIVSTVNRIDQILKNGSINSPKILICGITFKENVDDIRESHGLEIARALKKLHFDVSVWDPWVKQHTQEFEWSDHPDNAFIEKDLVLFTVPHREFVELKKNGQIHLKLQQMRNKIIFDGWGIFRTETFDNSVKYIGTGIGNSVQ